MLERNGIKTTRAHRFKGKLTTIMSKTDPGGVAQMWKGFTHILVPLRGPCLPHYVVISSDQAARKVMVEIH